MTLTVTLTAHSRNKFMGTFALYEVPKEYADPIFNYLVHGYHPGGFWNAVLANDFMSAMGRSHPANTIVALKKIVSWMMNHLVNGTTHGSYEVVDEWLKKPAEERRDILEALGLVYSEKQEIFMILKDEPTHEPQLW
jgi:hypothetical protein